MKLSATKIKDYKGCRRMYYFRYIEEIYPKEDASALREGSSYHDKLEEISNNGYFTPTNDKTDAMAMAYEKYIYPKFKVKKAEEWFEYKLNDCHTLIGRYDAIAEDGLLVEHKTTSIDLDQYFYDIEWSEQILCYMLAKGVNQMYYTVCKKPTIRQKSNESNEDYIQRCCEWYNEDTDDKIRVVKIERLQSDIDKFKLELINIADEIEEAEKKERLYCNSNHCMAYNRRCPYSSICLHYNPSMEYVEFTKKQKKEKTNDLF